MSKVIVERPRLGRSRASFARPGRSDALSDDDGEPFRARAPRRTRPLRSKVLNENLSPLKRYLASQVGRPWDKVYAEIATHLKPTSTVQQHVRDHIRDFVARGLRAEGRTVFVANRWGGEIALEKDWRPFFVHPSTGLLRRNPRPFSYTKARKAEEEAKKRERAARLRVVGPMVQLHRLDDGNWWEVTLCRNGHAPHPKGLRVLPRGEQGVDVVLRANLSARPPAELYGIEGVYAVEKHPLSKAEKKRLGLR